MHTIDALELVVSHDTIEMQRLARAQVETVPLADEGLKLVADHDVRTLGLQFTSVGFLCLFVALAL